MISPCHPTTACRQFTQVALLLCCLLPGKAWSQMGSGELRLTSAIVPLGSTEPIELIVSLHHSAPDIAAFSFGLEVQGDPLAPPLSIVDFEYIGPRAKFCVMDHNATQAVIGGVILETSELDTLAEGDFPVARLWLDASNLTPTMSPVVVCFKPDLEIGDIRPVSIEYSRRADEAKIVPDFSDQGLVYGPPSPGGSEHLDFLWIPVTSGVLRFQVATGTAELYSVPASSASAVAVDRAGTAWVVFQGDNTAHRYVTDTVENDVCPASLVPFVDTTTEAIDLPDDPPGVTADPRGVAVAPDRSVWLSVGNSVQRIHPSGAGLAPPLLGPSGVLGGSIDVGGQAQGLAVDLSGNVWVATNSPDSLVKVDATGSVVLQIFYDPPGTPAIMPARNNPRAVGVDRDGFVWVTLHGTPSGPGVTGIPGVVERRASDGSLVSTFPLLPNSRPGPLVVRHKDQPEAWVLDLEPTTPRLWRITDQQTTPISSSVLIGVDPVGLAADGRGRIWVAGSKLDACMVGAGQTPVLVRIPDDGGPAGGETICVDHAPVPFLGDASGHVQASVLLTAEFDDLDGDTFDNVLELQSGSSALDRCSTPMTAMPPEPFVPPVTQLECTVVGQQVQLTWVNLTGVTAILRNGALLTTLDMNQTTFLDPTDDPGNPNPALPADTYDYTLVAMDGPDSSVERTCRVVVGPGELGKSSSIEFGNLTTSLCDVTATTSTAGSTGDEMVAYYATDANRNVIVGLAADLRLVTVVRSPFDSAKNPVEDPSRLGGLAFNPLGASDPNNSDLPEGSLFVAGGGVGEQVQVAEISLRGDRELNRYRLTRTGGNVIGTPLSLAFSPDCEHVVVLLSGPLGCEIIAFTAIAMSEQPAVGPEVPVVFDVPIDEQLSFSHPDASDLVGLNGIEIPPGSGFGCEDPVGSGQRRGQVSLTSVSGSVLATGGGGGGGTPDGYQIMTYDVVDCRPPVAVSSFSLGAVEAENAFGGIAFSDDGALESVAAIGMTTAQVHEFLFNGADLTSGLTPPTEPEFIRGDCNSDGLIDIADPIFLLSVLFSGVDARCDSASDANDDEVRDLADVISLLNLLFDPTWPPPSDPYPGCGVDPTSGPLGCTCTPCP